MQKTAINKNILEIIINMFYSRLRYAGVAQLVEHLIRNEGVVGSSPVTGTRNKKTIMNKTTIIIIK